MGSLIEFEITMRLKSIKNKTDKLIHANPEWVDIDENLTEMNLRFTDRGEI